MTPKNNKSIGRPRLYPEGRKRHNLNIERSPEFDAVLIQAQQIIAGHRGLPMSAISQKEAVYRAIRFYVDCMTEMKESQ